MAPPSRSAVIFPPLRSRLKSSGSSRPGCQASWPPEGTPCLRVEARACELRLSRPQLWGAPVCLNGSAFAKASSVSQRSMIRSIVGRVGDGNFEDLHHGGNARKADISDRDAVAVAIRAGFFVSGKSRLDRLEAGGEPVDLPCAPGGVVEPAGCRKILFDPGHD